MRIPRLYIDQSVHSESQINLSQEKTHYISNVLRLRIGDPVKLFNDNDQEFDAKLISVTKKTAVLDVEASHEVHRESPLRVTLGIGISRGQHMDYSIQKAVELGVYQIVPILSEFSNVKLQDSRKGNKLSHWRNIMISATEQCGRTRLAKLAEPLSYHDYLNKDDSLTRLILHPEDNESLQGITINKNSLTLLVGPEGGFSKAEVGLAKDKGYRVAGLGPRILRAETAVVTAMSLCQHQWGDLSG